MKTAASCFCLLLCSVLCLLSAGCSVGRVEARTEEYSFTESVREISVNCSECDVVLLSGEEEGGRVVCRETDRITHEVKLSDGKLTVERKTSGFGTSWDLTNIPLNVAIYLPQGEYGALAVKTSSGSISIAEEFTFADASLESSSGAILINAAVTGELHIVSSSGNQYIGAMSPRSVTAQSSSGNIELGEGQPGSVSLKASSGDVRLFGVVAGTLDTETSSGDVTLQLCDAGRIGIRTSSGDITGSLTSAKDFRTKTSSGNVSLPPSGGTDVCELETSSGDIRITVEPPQKP